MSLLPRRCASTPTKSVVRAPTQNAGRPWSTPCGRFLITATRGPAAPLASNGARCAYKQQPTDYKVPVVPKRLSADGSMSPWDAAADAASREAEAARLAAAAAAQQAERAMLLAEMRARGGDVDALWGLAHTRHQHTESGCTAVHHSADQSDLPPFLFISVSERC
jgi:hypothetical protein